MSLVIDVGDRPGPGRERGISAAAGAIKRGDLVGREPWPLRRHCHVRVGGGDPGEHFAGSWLSRYDRGGPAVEFGRCGGGIVEPQSSFPRVGAVAGVAAAGEQRLDVAGEIDVGVGRERYQPRHGESCGKKRSQRRDGDSHRHSTSLTAGPEQVAWQLPLTNLF